MEAEVCAPGGSRRSMARAVIDVPEPASPARPRASPGAMLSSFGGKSTLLGGVLAGQGNVEEARVLL
jgi:hypothetical protein